jgi:ElaB/YqjD/DUF883 family membrane-anchored ribosome-binding protein
LADKARQAGAALTETAQRVGDQAKETASSLASDAQQRFHGYMDQQVAAGADLAGRVASVIKTAADELDRTSPALGGMVRSAGEKVQDLSQQFRYKTADEVLNDTRDFARRKPALVFGAAAALGFVAAHWCGDIGKHFANSSESCIVHDRRTLRGYRLAISRATSQLAAARPNQ